MGAIREFGYDTEACGRFMMPEIFQMLVDAESGTLKKKKVEQVVEKKKRKVKVKKVR